MTKRMSYAGPRPKSRILDAMKTSDEATASCRLDGETAKAAARMVGEVALLEWLRRLQPCWSCLVKVDKSRCGSCGGTGIDSIEGIESALDTLEDIIDAAREEGRREERERCAKICKVVEYGAELTDTEWREAARTTWELVTENVPSDEVLND